MPDELLALDSTQLQRYIKQNHILVPSRGTFSCLSITHSKASRTLKTHLSDSFCSYCATTLTFRYVLAIRLWVDRCHKSIILWTGSRSFLWYHRDNTYQRPSKVMPYTIGNAFRLCTPADSSIRKPTSRFSILPTVVPACLLLPSTESHAKLLPLSSDHALYSATE